MENRINHIIARVLSGESSSDDILSLSEWLNESPQNQEEFRRLKSYWDAEVTFKHGIVPAFAADKFFGLIAQERKRIRRISFWHRYMPWIAATVLLFAFSATFFLNRTGGQHVSEYYTLLTDEHKSDFTLEDGTIITLNKNSRLRYSDAYGKKERVVRLEGEAYFKVAKDPEKPFQVEMNGASIIVLGTHFNVKADLESDEITATLVEGAIRFEGADEKIILAPNQQLTFSRSSSRANIKQVDPDLFTAWKDGLLKYKSIPFANLIKELENVYQVKIRLGDAELARSTTTVSGTFSKDQNIEQILKVISRSLPIRWYNSNGTYYIQYATNKKEMPMK